MRFIKSSALALAASLSGAASANHIDFLVDGGFSLSGGVSFDTQTGSPGNVLGAERMVDLLSFGSATAELNVPPGPAATDGPNPGVTLDYSNDDEGALVLTYDGVGSAGLGGANLITNGVFVWDSLEFLFSDVMGVFELDITIEDTMSVAGISNRLVSSVGPVVVDYSDFAGVDLMSVDALTFSISNVSAGSFSLGEITRELQNAAPVPLPSTLWLFGLAVFAAVARRLKR